MVGVDGSMNSLSALRFAISEAALRGGRVEAVLCWHRPFVAGDVWMPVSIDLEQMEQSYRDELEEVVASVDASALSAPVERLLIEGTPAHALLEAAKGAAMLVVGSRGHGGFLGLLLGSVSHQVAAHAPCPVVIVPALPPV